MRTGTALKTTPDLVSLISEWLNRLNPLAFSQSNDSLQKSSDSDGDIPLLVKKKSNFNFNSSEAVSQDYIDEVRTIVKELPEERYNLNNPDCNLNTAVEKYLELEYEGFEGPANPFNLIMPSTLRIGAWVCELGLEHKKRYPDTWSPVEDKFIRLMNSWNRYYLGVLEALNIPNPVDRKERIDQMGIEIFDKEETISVFKKPPLKEISPNDDAIQWFAYNALNVLLSPEQRVTPLARYRAIETLSSYDINELAEKFLGEERDYNARDSKGNIVRSMPYSGFKHWFEKQMLRLPRSFWLTDEEKTQPIHTKWRANKTIEDIFGFVNPRYNQKQPIDYNKAFNTLVTKYPSEAVHMALMVFTNEDLGAGFAGLVALGRLDPVAANDVFGSSATYLTLRNMPANIFEHISHGLGTDTCDHDFAEDYESLPKNDILQTLRRTLQQNAHLEEKISNMNEQWANTYFSATPKRNIDKVDPEGYWRLLGVHPDTNQDDLDIVLKAAYRRLSQKYHPDMTENPDLERMKTINLAFGILSDPQKRKQYSGSA